VFAEEAKLVRTIASWYKLAYKRNKSPPSSPLENLEGKKL
jgi:hypothetical protein